MRWRRKHLRLREQALFVMGPQTFGSVEHVEVSWSAEIALTEASLSSNALRTSVSGTTIGYSLNRVEEQSLRFLWAEPEEFRTTAPKFSP